MELVTIVVSLALLEYLAFGALVGKARATYSIHAPAVSGNEMFERYFRAHQNTLESLIIFIPAIFAFAHYVNAQIAAALGIIFIIGRAMYFKSYVKDPKSRGPGLHLSVLPSFILLLGGCIGAAIALWKT